MSVKPFTVDFRQTTPPISPSITDSANFFSSPSQSSDSSPFVHQNAPSNKENIAISQSGSSSSHGRLTVLHPTPQQPNFFDTLSNISGKLDTLLSELVEIKTEQRTMKEDLRLVKAFQKERAEIEKGVLLKKPDIYPLLSIEDLLKAEEDENAETREAMKKYLVQMGGSTMRSFFILAVKELFNDALTYNLSVDGQRKNFRLKGTKHYEMMFEAANQCKTTMVFPESVSKTSVDEELRQAIRAAKNRRYNRLPSRNEKKSENIEKRLEELNNVRNEVLAIERISDVVEMESERENSEEADDEDNVSYGENDEEI